MENKCCSLLSSVTSLSFSEIKARARSYKARELLCMCINVNQIVIYCIGAEERGVTWVLCRQLRGDVAYRKEKNRRKESVTTAYIILIPAIIHIYILVRCEYVNGCEKS